jgi:hypothetical protein
MYLYESYFLLAFFIGKGKPTKALEYNKIAFSVFLVELSPFLLRVLSIDYHSIEKFRHFKFIATPTTI